MVSGYLNLINFQFQLLKNNTPNPITFLFKLNKRLPNAFFIDKKSVGVRLPASNIAAEIVDRLGVPLVCTTVALKNASKEESVDPSLIWDEFSEKVDIMVGGGFVTGVGTMVVSVSDDDAEILRENENIELIYN